MNMMKVQEEREENAVPAYGFDDGPGFTNRTEGSDNATAPEETGLFKRFAWFRNQRIAAKVNTIFASFAIVIAVTVIVLAAGLMQVSKRYQVSDQLQSAITAAGDLRADFGEVHYNTSYYLLDPDPEVMTRKRAAMRAALSRIDAIEPIVGEHAQGFSARAIALRAELTGYTATFEEPAGALSASQSSADVRRLARDIARRGDQIVASTAAFQNDLFEYNKNWREAALSQFKFMIGWVLALVLLAALLLIAGFGFLSRDLATKVTEITNAMTRLANGDRKFAIEGCERKDEIGQMIRALEMFKRAGRQLELWARERSELAEKELRAQAERAREREEAEQRRAALIANVASGLERTVGEVVGKVAAAAGELQTTARQMADTADTAANRTTELTESMTEANSGATAAAAASDEFAMSIGEISRQAASSSELARLASDATKEADTTISALSASANEVGHIVELISTIAQRTNLLALNASIEAARGGEAGRGFAVVASEVKELAMQTSRATEQVAEQIRAMQDTTGASVSALRSIALQVKELESTAVSIASAVDQQSVAGQDLARSIDLAASGTQKVADRIADVRELSLSTGAAAGQVLTSASELQQQASTLKAQVSAFLSKVRED